MKNVNRVQKKQLGQGMTEYIIIVALVAVAAIGAYGMFGQTVKHQVAGLANEISGTTASTEVEKAVTSAEAAVTAADSTVDGNNMGTFHKGATTTGK